MELENLPWQIIVDILSRLHDASDLCRCKIASKHLLQLSSQVHSVRFYCTLTQFLRSRRSGDRMIPFKTLAKNILLELVQVQSIRFDMEESMQRLCYEDEDGELSDYWLTDVEFMMEWVEHVGGSLRELCITDFWQQSCWRCTEILSLISGHCKTLCTLELRNAWLSVEGLQKMYLLTSLTLEYIRLNDESLTMVNQCFPALERLFLINVGGLKHPCICLQQLRVCHWTVSNSPASLKLVACKLDEIKLECCRPEKLIIEAPFLVSFHLSMERPGRLFEAANMSDLRFMALRSFDLCSIIGLLSGRKFVNTLFLELPVLIFDEDGHLDGLRKSQGPSSMPGLEELAREFTALHTLIIGPGAWYTLEHLLHKMDDSSSVYRLRCLKKLILNIVLFRVENACKTIRKLLHVCPMLFDVEVHIHWDSMPDDQNHFISKSQTEMPHVRWKWNVWSREGLHGRYT